MRSEGAFGVSGVRQRQTKKYYRRMNLQFIIILCDKDKEQDLCIQFDLFDFTTLHSRAAYINIVFFFTITILCCWDGNDILGGGNRKYNI